MLAGAVVGALVLQSGVAAAETSDEGTPTADAVVEEVHEAAREAGMDNGNAILEQEVTLELPDEQGSTEPVTLSIEEAIVRVAGRTIIDSEEHSGYLGLPWGSAGNIMHAYVDVLVSGPTVLPWQAELPEAPDADSLLHYDVVESDYVPNTPIVPVINPLLLAPADTPEELDLPPLLAMHWGGPLKSVQGSGWLMGFHSAGTTPLGSSVDTQDRSGDEDAQAPFWIPLIEDGELAIEDEAIDFAGFAVVTQDASCERIQIDSPPRLSGLIPGFHIVTDVCASFGLLLGDGVTFFDGEGPFDLREDGALLWEPAPEPVKQVVDAVGDVLGEVPTDEILGDVLGLVGDTDLDDLTGDEPADDGETGETADSTAGGLLDGLLGGLRR